MFLALTSLVTAVLTSMVTCSIREDRSGSEHRLSPCAKAGRGTLKFIWGDALLDDECVGPEGLRYPSQLVESIVSQSINRTLQEERRKRLERSAGEGEDWGTALLQGYLQANRRTERKIPTHRGRAAIPDKLRRVLCSPDGETDPVEDRLCSSEYNTTAPMFGVSMTSGETVAIVQKFPDLLQQIVYERCTSPVCRLLRGSCQQTFVPYLFLTVPLGPVTLTGQDYVLVESGCICKPRMTSPRPEEL